MPQIILDTQNGLTIPALTTAQKNAIASPNTGALVYDTTLGKVSDYNGSSWDVATVLSQFASSISGPTGGYQVLPSGIIIQWFAIADTTTSTVGGGSIVSGSNSFPIAFPNALLRTIGGSTGDIQCIATIQNTGVTNSTFNYTLSTPYLPVGQPVAGGFIAIGY